MNIVWNQAPNCNIFTLHNFSSSKIHPSCYRKGLCAAIFLKEKQDIPVKPNRRLIFGCEGSSLLTESNNPNYLHFSLNLTCSPCVMILVVCWHPPSIHKNSHTGNIIKIIHSLFHLLESDPKL